MYEWDRHILFEDYKTPITSLFIYTLIIYNQLKIKFLINYFINIKIFKYKVLDNIVFRVTNTTIHIKNKE